jgi:hypothetical protein
MGLRSTKGMKNPSVQQPLSIEPTPFPFCHPERSRGICSSAGPSWKCFQQNVVERSAVSFTSNADSCAARLKVVP